VTKGLLMDWAPTSGKRAGGFDPKDRRFRCDPSWQNTKTGKEVRVAIEDKDVGEWRNVPGIVVLYTDEEIDAAVAELQPEEPTFSIQNEALLVEYIRQANIDITNMSQDRATLAKQLHEAGCVGVHKKVRKPCKCRDLIEAHTFHERNGR